MRAPSVIGLVLSCSLAGCVPGSLWVTATATVPPVPYVEVSDVAPGPSHVWIDGYWWWDGTQYIWVRGYWGVPPVSGYVWVYGGWVQEGRRYVYVHGRWVPPGTARPVTYVHPRPVTVRVRPGATYRATPPRRVVTPMSPRR